ncbi:MAG: glycogen/starch synthase [Muribaculaceae bacterium]|nr:glycogen/starch synthase [Muribaculaceae bacterium]
MAAHKIIFVSQEISPYLSATDNARWGRSLPQSIQQRKYEVRTFMPDYGDINERRNQLHEVIRLSGMNIAIADNDHPLVVKVASMQPSRIQVYFMDNDDYFQKLDSDSDVFGTNRADNDERLIFFARGTMETARKLRWDPEIMQVSGWVSALVPLYLKHLFQTPGSFEQTRLVYTVLPGAEVESVDAAIFDKLIAEGIDAKVLEPFREIPLDHSLLHKMAIANADAVVFQTPEADPALVEYCESLGKPWRHFDSEGDHADEYDELYKSLMA